jgi:hypothetical protein
MDYITPTINKWRILRNFTKSKIGDGISLRVESCSDAGEGPPGAGPQSGIASQVSKVI